MWKWIAGLAALLGLQGAWTQAGASGPEPPTVGGRVAPDIVARVLLLKETARREIDGLRHVSLPLVLAVIARETGGIARPGADGEQGLMQVSKAAFTDYVNATGATYLVWPGDMMAPNLNIRVGAWFLDRKIYEMGDVYNGLRAYNAGTRGARENPTRSGAYAEWVVNVGVPSFAAIPGV